MTTHTNNQISKPPKQQYVHGRFKTLHEHEETKHKPTNFCHYGILKHLHSLRAENTSKEILGGYDNYNNINGELHNSNDNSLKYYRKKARPIHNKSARKQC